MSTDSSTLLYSCKINSLSLHKNVLRIIPKTAFAAAAAFAHGLLDVEFCGHRGVLTPATIDARRVEL